MRVLIQRHPWVLLVLSIQVVLLWWGFFVWSNFDFGYSGVGADLPVGLEWHTAPDVAQDDLGGLLQPWLRWDTLWYLEVAAVGYQEFDGRLAFPPLYPALINIVSSLLGGRDLLAGMLISIVAYYAACYLLYQDARQNFDADIALKTILFMTLFPTSFFWLAGYSEALFLLFLMLAWRAAGQANWLQVGIFGALMVLARFFGVFIFPVLLIRLWRSSQGREIKQYLYLSLMPAALAAWVALSRVLYGRYIFDDLGLEWNRLVWAWPWEGFVQTALAFVGRHEYSPVFSNYLDFFLLLLFIGLLIWMVNNLSWEYTLLSGVVLLATLVKILDIGFFMSQSRYILPIFPAFIALAHLARHRWFNLVWFTLSLLGLMTSAMLFFRWVWIA